jgi:site-specific recombinase XerD
MHDMFNYTFSTLKLKASSHDFRHTKITELVNAGMDISQVQQYVGHTDVKTTLSYVAKRRTADILQSMVMSNL